MANPNIVSVSSIYGESVAVHLTATLTTTLMTVSSNKLLKINSITCANVDGTNDAELTLYVSKANFTPNGITNFDTSGDFYIVKSIGVPAGDVLHVIEKPLYIMEADVLKGGASAAGDLDLFISYEVIDDA